MTRGSISRRSGKYLARFIDPASGREHSKAFARKQDAQRWLTEQVASLDRGALIDPKSGRLTVGEWSQTWMASRVHLKPKTVASYRSLLDTQVLPRWSATPMSLVRRSDVAAWVADMHSRLSASRARQSYHLLNAMLNDAVRDGRIARNAAVGITLPRLPKTNRRYLTHDELAALADACGPHRLLVLLLGYTGLRWGEAAGLKARRVDPLRGRIDVVEAVTEVNGRLVWGPPKTHAQRTVVVPRFLRAELAARLPADPDALVFPSRVGTPLRVGNVRRGWFDPAARDLGLDGLVPHELRHTAASLAIGAGASILGVQRMLGHASGAMTLDRYGHLLDDELDAVADRLDEARGPRGDRCRPGGRG